MLTENATTPLPGTTTAQKNLNAEKVDHLLLLVGGNPLPNAVAGLLLLKPGGRITLLYSGQPSSEQVEGKGTANTTLKLLEFFFARKILDDTQLRDCSGQQRVEEWDPQSIIAKVETALNASEAAHAQSIGLHYTGGTKAMSVHAYRTVEKWCAENEKLASYSYLDARGQQLVFEPSGRRVPTTGLVEIGLATMMDLHGWEFAHPPIGHALLPQTAMQIAQFNYDPDNQKIWDKWLSDELYGSQRNGTLKIQKVNAKGELKNKSDTELDTITLRTPAHRALALRFKFTSLEPLFQSLATESGLNSPDPLPAELSIKAFAGSLGSSNTELVEWLKGKWLECAVFQALEEIRNEGGLDEVKMAVKPDVGGGADDFDFDVVAIRGYQFFGFSCGTAKDNNDAKRKELKHKLFEVYVRAHQLGGDQACAALVCRSQNRTTIQAEMRQTIPESGERIRVFESRELADLKLYFQEWITQQSRGR